MKRLKLYSELLKLEHTIFALPFGLASLLILYQNFPSWGKILYIILALIFARTLGMALNRLIDKPFDEKNPRTSIWPHAKGLVKDWEIKLIIILSCLLFLFSCYKINLLAFLLSPIVIFALFIYPFAKRFTYFPHFFLGLVYFLIPVAIDVALNEKVSLIAIFLGIAMACWVSGFDILYSLQDLEFDKKMGLKSIPVKFGIRNALKIAKFLHLITFFSLLLTGYLYSKATWIYFVGLSLIALFLAYEHSLIKENDLSKINKAFFTTNGFISIIFFLVIIVNNLYYLLK
jgi:4-hydroxybenzoate polyprenyltransferase